MGLPSMHVKSWAWLYTPVIQVLWGPETGPVGFAGCQLCWRFSERIFIMIKVEVESDRVRHLTSSFGFHTLLERHMYMYLCLLLHSNTYIVTHRHT